MRSKLVVANWKMHGTRDSAAQLLTVLKQQLVPPMAQTVVVCVPFVYLQLAQDILAGSAIHLGVQTLNEHAPGAYTGEISAQMLLDFNTRYVLVGHSERRTFYHESDEQIADKFCAAQAAKFIPILCVGEQLDQRQNGATEHVIGTQLERVLSRKEVDWSAALIAYEPVWAIGTGQTASPEQAQEVHQFIRQQLAATDAADGQKLPILYGGSVKADNAAQLFKMADIDGALVGGASLDADQFIKICHAAG